MFTFSRPLRPAAVALLLALCAQAQAQVPSDVVRGQRLWQQRCAECHAVDTDETGPRHRSVFGRRAGSVKGYDYTRALRGANLRWDAANLDRWLKDPQQFLPGQGMDFKTDSRQDRADLIAYLKSLAEPVVQGAAPVRP